MPTLVYSGTTASVHVLDGKITLRVVVDGDDYPIRIDLSFDDPNGALTLAAILTRGARLFLPEPTEPTGEIVTWPDTFSEADE